MDEEELQEFIYQNVDVKPDLTLDIKVKVEDQEEQDESSGPEYEDEAEEEEESAEWMYNEDETTTNTTELTTSDINNGEIRKGAWKKKRSLKCPNAGCLAPPFSNYKALRTHRISNHSSFPCPLCSIPPLKNGFEYRSHTKTAHAEQYSPSPREYKCELCPPEKPPFLGIMAWWGHIKAHLMKIPIEMRKTPGILKIHPSPLTDDDDDDFAPPDNVNYEDNNNCKNEDCKPTATPPLSARSRSIRFICNFKRCTVEFPDSQSLADHQQTSHKRTPLAYPCPTAGCSLVYSSIVGFNLHVQKCQLQQSWICPVENCGREFPNIQLLQNHRSSHSSNTIYRTCPVEGCNRRLKKKNFGAWSHIQKCMRERGIILTGDSRTGEKYNVKVLQNMDDDDKSTTRVIEEEQETEEEESALDLPKVVEQQQQLVESGESVPADPDLDPDLDPLSEQILSETSETPPASVTCICPLCPHPPFINQKDQRSHTASHAFKGRKQYKCELCPPEMSSFFTLGTWRHHIDAHLNKVPRSLRCTPGILKIYPCALVDPKDSVSIPLATTVPLLKSKRFICSFKKCHIEFEDSTSLKEHEKGHKTQLTYHCPVEGCTRTFRAWGFFFKHIESCERKNLKKGTEENQNQNQNQEDPVKVDDPEVEGMEVEADQSDGQEVGIVQTRNGSIKGDKNGMRHCPVEGCNRIILVGNFNRHLSMCRVWTEKRQRGEFPKRQYKVKERKPVETVECPVEGCSRILFRGQGYTMHVKKCRRDLEERRQAGSIEFPSSNSCETSDNVTVKKRPKIMCPVEGCTKICQRGHLLYLHVKGCFAKMEARKAQRSEGGDREVDEDRETTKVREKAWKQTHCPTPDCNSGYFESAEAYKQHVAECYLEQFKSRECEEKSEFLESGPDLDLPVNSTGEAEGGESNATPRKKPGRPPKTMQDSGVTRVSPKLTHMVTRTRTWKLGMAPQCDLQPQIQTQTQIQPQIPAPPTSAAAAAAILTDDTQPRKPGRPRKRIIQEDCGKSSEMTRVPSDPTLIVTAGIKEEDTSWVVSES